MSVRQHSARYNVRHSVAAYLRLITDRSVHSSRRYSLSASRAPLTNRQLSVHFTDKYLFLSSLFASISDIIAMVDKKCQVKRSEILPIVIVVCLLC